MKISELIKALEEEMRNDTQVQVFWEGQRININRSSLIRSKDGTLVIDADGFYEE